MKQKPRDKGSLHLSRATTKARPAVHADHLEGGPRLLWDEPKIFFLERRYFFSIILSEFLKNRVTLQIRRFIAMPPCFCGLIILKSNQQVG